MKFIDRLSHAWNAFTNKDPTKYLKDLGMSYSIKPDRPRLTLGNERSIIAAIYTRIAIDVSSVDIKHVRLDENGRFREEIKSGLNECLTLRSNIDQSSRSFMQDVVLSLFDEGVIAIVPVDTSINPAVSSSFDIRSLRTAKIIEWYPEHVRLRLYNDKTGLKEEIVMKKKNVAIVENPLYSVMNEPNSTLKRLVHKLNLLDSIDEQNGSAKLDLIIQLPYVIKSKQRREQAEDRRKDIEMQLAGSKYGIAYTDGTERVTQLNRPVESNLMPQIEYLTSMLYSQLGMTEEILNGTADETISLNYYNRTIDPILCAIVDAMKYSFLTQTARTQGQSIMFFRDPFRLVPVANLADIADKFTRNEILSSNEVRAIIGYKPVDTQRAEELSNKNMPVEDLGMEQQPLLEEEEVTEEDYDDAMMELDDLDVQLDELEASLGLLHYASPYYDPVKAHEYYMRTRELKGRKSTAGLNEKGKSAAQYIKEQLDAERKGKVDAHKSSTKNQIENVRSSTKSQVEALRNQTTRTIEGKRDQMKREVESHKTQMQSKITSLREKLKGMSAEDKEKHSAAIQEEIAKLREDNTAKRQELQAAYSSESNALRETQKSKTSSLNEAKSKKTRSLNEAHTAERSRLKEEYDQKYINELDKLKGESQFKKTKKSKKSSSKKSSKKSKKNYYRGTPQ